MTITVKTRKRKQANYYIYYNDWTGEILSVGQSIRNDSVLPYIVVQDENAGYIISGEKNVNDFIVDPSTQDRLIVKNDYYHLREKENSLFLIPKNKAGEWDIRVRLFKKNHKLLFEINRARIKRIVSKNIGREIKVTGGKTLDFYITRKDRVDYLLETASVDVGELINQGYFLLDMEYVSSYAAYDEISLLTQKQFEFYTFDIVDQEYHENDHQIDAKPHIWNVANGGEDSHLRLSQADSIITVESLVKADRFDNLGIAHKIVPLYIVGESPDNYLDRIDVDLSEIRLGRPEKFRVDFDLSQVNIMCQNMSLRIDKRKVK